MVVLWFLLRKDNPAQVSDYVPILSYMATPPHRNTAQTNATVNYEAIKLADNQRFIQGAGDAILMAISLGKFEVTLTTFVGCSVKELHNYFVSLGYVVRYPGLGMLPGPRAHQPAELFGECWNEYWGSYAPHVSNPARMTLRWGPEPSGDYELMLEDGGYIEIE